MSEPEKPSPEALELARRLDREGPPSEDAWDVWAARLIEAFGERAEPDPSPEALELAIKIDGIEGLDAVEKAARLIDAWAAKRETQLRIDADHDWALWHEKWCAALDLVGSLGESVARVQNNWPHIEIPAGSERRGVIVDPGAPTCLRCKIEELLNADVR